MTRVVFLGSPDFAVPSLRALHQGGYQVVGVVTQPDREAGRGRRLMPPAVKQAALELGIAVLQPPSLRRPEAVAELAALGPDVIVVAAFGQILRPAVLVMPPRGVINVHASLLPRWRGAAPVTAALLAGDDVTGVSIMEVDEGLDTGPMLSRRETDIAVNETAGALTQRLALLGAELLLETLPDWLSGALTPEPQDDAVATYAGRLEKEAGQLDWTEPAAVIWRKVRAYTPWPGAGTEYRGSPLRVLAAWPLALQAAGQPGDVVALRPGDAAAVPAELARPAFAVVTGAGLLAPLKLQRAGKRPLFAEEFARGERDLIGGRFVALVH